MDITKASDLISRFYDGSISPEELAGLNAFFKENRSALPEEMSADCDLIIALSALSMPEEIPDAPKDLEERINKSLGFAPATPERQTPVRRRRWLLALIPAGGIAAAVALLITAGGAGENGNTAMVSPSQPVAKELAVITDSDGIKDNQNGKSVSPAVKSATDFVSDVTSQPGEVTDIERGREITAGALQILKNNLSVAHGSLASINGNFAKYNNHVKKILNKNQSL